MEDLEKHYVFKIELSDDEISFMFGKGLVLDLAIPGFGFNEGNNVTQLKSEILDLILDFVKRGGQSKMHDAHD